MTECLFRGKPSSYYAGLFREADVEIRDFRYAYFVTFLRPPGFDYSTIDMEQASRVPVPETIGFCRLGGDEMDIYFPVTDGKVEQKYIEAARSVLAQLAEMEAMYRVRGGADQNEEVVHIEIFEEDEEGICAGFHYTSGKHNAEWDAFYLQQDDGTWVLDDIG